jgi:hypothetical protein
MGIIFSCFSRGQRFRNESCPELQKNKETIQNESFNQDSLDPVPFTICKRHLLLGNECIESHLRFKCLSCNKKNVHGYSNTIFNNSENRQLISSAGYPYLAPNLCNECSFQHKRCAWC